MGHGARIVRVHLRWEIHSDFAVIERTGGALLYMCSSAVSSAVGDLSSLNADGGLCDFFI